ncbi:dihydrodipicolinate synthase family protein [Enterovirga sp. CN4-39]|uniref:dihydrodipicolinate synthase family protein n=1 Tax=Enterovirga sp. CN4-39 TaxID=3400910 RepID=UPI003C09A07B
MTEFSKTSPAARLSGIHAATICPFDGRFEIEETALARHVAEVCAVPGIDGLLINGHAGENFVLDPAEKARVVSVIRAALGPDVFLTCGINAESSLQAARDAEAAEAAGADAVLLFPPNAWGLGQTPEAVRLHHEAVISACGLPIVLYQAPVGAGGMPYPVPTLLDLVRSDRVIGIKEGSWEAAAYEQNRRAVKAVRPDIAVLGSGDEHLLACYLLGTEGSQVSLAAIVPEAVVALWQAAQAEDWTAARAWHDAIYPLAVAIYRERPGSYATARLKACLKILGRLGDDRARPPVPPLSPEEYRRLEAALAHADRASQSLPLAREQAA